MNLRNALSQKEKTPGPARKSKFVLAVPISYKLLAIKLAADIRLNKVEILPNAIVPFVF